MLVPGALNALLVGGGAVASGLQISRSLRVNQPDTAYLSRTFGAPGNLKTWTVSFWSKPTLFADLYVVISCGTYSGGSTGNVTLVSLDYSQGGLSVEDFTGASLPTRNIRVTATGIPRDPTAWYHFVVAVDTTQATAANRVKLYQTGAQLTSLSQSTYPSLNYDTYMNGTSAAHQWGKYAQVATTSNNYDGYLAECYFIDGAALTPSSFGAMDVNGEWSPKAYSGAFGTNGSHLTFADNSNTTAATLGKDTSGNANNWTPNNFSVAAGVGNDSLTDTPTNFGTDTGVGGEVRGNYATLNPVDPVGTAIYTNGALAVTVSSSDSARATWGVSEQTGGKWCWEYQVSSVTAQSFCGVQRSDQLPANLAASGPQAYCYYGSTGNYFANAGSGVAYGAAYDQTNLIRVELNASASPCVIEFFKDNVSQGQKSLPALSAGQYWLPCISAQAASILFNVNFGQRAWAASPTAGFKAFCTQNLPTPSIVKSATAYLTNLRTGTGGSTSVTGMLFAPDFVWIKSRSAATNNNIFDTTRGATKGLSSNTNAAQYTDATTLTAFNGDGYSLGADTTPQGVNVNTATYADWVWRKGVAYGLDIILYTGDGTSNRNINHSLGVAPQYAINIPLAHTATTSLPFVWQTALAGATSYLFWSGTAAQATTATPWGTGNWSSTQFMVTVNGANDTNLNAASFVQYLWAPVAGFSAFGSYVGNAAADGPYVYCGFRPAYIMLKNASAGATDWTIKDTARNPYNVANLTLDASDATAEATTGVDIDVDASGFKIRNANGNTNGIGNTIIYAAFAEYPFKYARAR